MNIYLDNAATTPLDPRVLEAMTPYLTETFGNPSSIHSHGRKAKAAVEVARRKVADLLNTSPSEIFFTSGGTEADNMAITCTAETRDIQHIVTTAIEHHAVLHTVQEIAKKGTKVTYLDLDTNGNPDLQQLAHILESERQVLVTLMHANNEIGNLLPISDVAELCREYGAVFHSDTVQTVGHYKHDLASLPIQYMVGSAHKFHGPKGIGFLYMNAEFPMKPFIYGGAQERNMRGGTENLPGIIGLATALELAYADMDEDAVYISGLKEYMIAGLKNAIPEIKFNGLSGQTDQSLYTVLNASLPPSDASDMLLFSLDIQGISVSGGSACSSGTDVGSHVLRALNVEENRAAVRFSFSRFNTRQEIDYTIRELSAVLK